jgi:hypothetical protein
MTTRLHREILKSPLARTGVGCAAVLLFLVALLTAFTFWNRLSQARATADWKAVSGTVAKVGIETTWSSGQTQYLPRVTYRFEHEGTSHTGNRITPRDLTCGSRSKAEELITAYSPNSEVTVYYNPEDPTQSVLQPGAEGTDYLLLGFPVLFLLFAYGFLQMLMRARQASRSPEASE